MSSVFLAVKHNFCSLDLLSWVLHNHIRNPFKMSRAWRIFFSPYTCPTVLPSVKRNCYLLSESNCVYFRHSHVFKADRSNLWGKVSHFSKVRGLSLKLLFPSFLSGFQKYWFRYMAAGARKGVKLWGARWRDGDYTIPPFSEWSWNRGVLWSPSHTLSWGQAGEKKHLCAWNYVLLTCFQGAHLESSRKSWMHISSPPPFQVARYE